jgi:hypothetical protein
MASLAGMAFIFSDQGIFGYSGNTVGRARGAQWVSDFGSGNDNLCHFVTRGNRIPIR